MTNQKLFPIMDGYVLLIIIIFIYMTSPECPLPQDTNILEGEEPHALQDLIERIEPKETQYDLQADLLDKQQRDLEIVKNMRKYAGKQIPNISLPVAV